MRWLLLALASCTTWNAPLPVTPVPGGPCGETGVVCGGHMCCAEGDACGGTPGCPAGMCCYIGDDGQSMARPARKR